MVLLRDSQLSIHIKLSSLRRCVMMMSIVCMISGGGKKSSLSSSDGAPPRDIQTDKSSNAWPGAKMPHRQLQDCLDAYIGTGRWVDDKWVSTKNPCDFQQWSLSELTSKFRGTRFLFSGDSTTRSDLATFTESNGCGDQNWDEGAVFQRKGENGTYDCAQAEQAMDIAKCGQPPIVDVSCQGGIDLRYVYKVWPWAPLDEVYFTESAEKFQDIDVIVLSNGRWYPLWDNERHGELEIEKNLERYLARLRKVFSGLIIFQTEYAEHETFTLDNAVNCTHGTCGPDPDCPPHSHCAYASVEPRPDDRLDSIRKVMERHEIPYIDRWKIGDVLPHAYYELFYCGNDFHHHWFCDHHLHFVGMMHLSLVENVMSRTLVRPTRTSTW